MSFMAPVPAGSSFKKRSRVTVAPRHRYVLELHLAGYKLYDKEMSSGSIKPGITTLTGYKASTIYNILNSEGIAQLRQQIVKNLDSEFEAQYGRVVDAIGSCLEEGKPDEVKLKAAKLWGDYFKRFQKVEVNQTLNVTAEDVVFQIMNNNNYEKDLNPSIDITPQSGE